MENADWLRASRKKFKATVNAMTVDQRKILFGHAMTDEIKRKISIAKIGKTKTNSDGVARMAQTKAANVAKMTTAERKARFSTTTGWRWYHNDEIKASKLMAPNNVNTDWTLGRKFYEN